MRHSAAMATGGGSGDLKSATKCFLFSINLVTFIFGLVLFFLGVVLQTQYGTYFEFLEDSFYNLSAWCTGMGVAVCAVSFLGLHGAIRENYCSLLAFSILLGFAILLELSLGVSAFALLKKSHLEASIAHKMTASLEQYGQPDKGGVKKVWDILQTDFSCCGVDFPGNWASTPWAREQDSPDLLPDSCCSKLPLGRMCKMGGAAGTGQEEGGAGAEQSSAHTDGCLKALESSAKRNAGALGGIASVIGVGQVCLVVAACHLLKHLKRPDRCAPCW